MIGICMSNLADLILPDSSSGVETILLLTRDKKDPKFSKYMHCIVLFHDHSEVQLKNSHYNNICIHISFLFVKLMQQDHHSRRY